MKQQQQRARAIPDVPAKPFAVIQPAVEVCRDCVFALEQSSRPFILCRRYPSATEKYPSDWCGEFKARG